MIQANAVVRLQGPPAAKASGKVLRWCLAGALCLLAVGCGAGTTAQAEATQGQFQLVFELPRSDWHTSDSITGEATLSYLGSGSVSIGASGTVPIGFNFKEVGGSRHMDWVWTQALVVFRLDADKPITSPIKKSLAWTPDDPNADFYGWFAHDPLVHLPAGDWTITAVAAFQDGSDSGSDQYTLQATVRVHVTA
ncbi:MAG: hypothetical protein ABSA21_01400 [Candidatus Limnocylindrales bacterium]